MFLTLKKLVVVNFVFLSELFGNSKIEFNPYDLDPNFKVTKVHTPVDHIKIFEVLCKSHKKINNKKPNDNRLSMAWAQISLENGRGKKIWNNNLGNQGPHHVKQKYYLHLRNGWPYRSFDDLDESGISYWRIINRCSSALQAFDAGDVNTAALYLKKCNYYGSDAESYTKTLKNLYYEARYKILPEVSCEEGN